MMRFQTTITALLASLLVVPVLIGQGQVDTLQDALSGTKRALEVLKGLEKKLGEDPATALALVLSATEAPGGSDVQREDRLESLRSEVNLLQMELDALQSPALAGDGAVQDSLGTRAPSARTGALPSAGITTGMDDSLRALLSGAPQPRTSAPVEPAHSEGAASDEEFQEAETIAYSADPLRHGITCYRAGRYAEAYELLAPLDDGSALYWQARTLERLERLDEAVKVMERALAKGGEGFEARRAQTDLEFLRWKRDFVQSMPAQGKKDGPR
jgi:tetratricopeptide (TPR) repeat protein